MNIKGCAVAALGLLLGCSAPSNQRSPEPVGSTSSAVTVPELTPTPCGLTGNSDKHPSWDRSVPQLLFADALVECEAAATDGSAFYGGPASSNSVSVPAGADLYLADTLSAINEMDSGVPASVALRRVSTWH